MSRTTKSGLPKRASKKAPRANGLTRIDTLELISNLDSRHQQVAPLLEKLVQGKKVSSEEIAALDSKHIQVQPILSVIAGVSDAAPTLQRKAIETLESTHEPLKPILTALTEGFKK